VSADHVAKMAKGQLQKADIYWKQQSKDVASILRGLLSKDLEDLIHSHGLPQLSAADLIMLIVKHCTSSSFEHWETLKKEIKEADPNKFAGCNITLYVNYVRVRAKELLNAGAWSNLLFMYICKAYCKAAEPLFVLEFAKDRSPLNDLLKRFGQESTTIANQAFLAAGFTPLQYLEKGGDSTKETRKCFNCNETGHVAAQCPKKQAKSTKPSGAGGKKPTNAPQPAKKPKWRETAPAANEKKIKVENEKIYFWCKDCRGGKGLWTSTHRKHGAGNDIKGSELKNLKKQFERDGHLPEVNLAEAADYDCDSDGVAFE